MKARPKAFGEVNVADNIPGVELLEQEDQGSSDEDIDRETSDNLEDDSVNLVEEDGRGESDSGDSNYSDHELRDGSDRSGGEDDEVSDGDDTIYGADDASEIEEDSEENADDEHVQNNLLEIDNSIGKDADVDNNKSKEKKRKFSDFEGQLNAANKSLRALKKLAGTTDNVSSTNDGILSNEDFQRIRELKVCVC